MLLLLLLVINTYKENNNYSLESIDRTGSGKSKHITNPSRTILNDIEFIVINEIGEWKINKNEELLYNNIYL